MQSDLVSLEAEPLEETGFGSGSGYEGGDEIPAFLDVVYLRDPDVVPLAVLADDPYQNLEVADTPVPLEFAGLGHPWSEIKYFSMRFSVY